MGSDRCEDGGDCTLTVEQKVSLLVEYGLDATLSDLRAPTSAPSH